MKKNPLTYWLVHRPFTFWMTYIPFRISPLLKGPCSMFMPIAHIPYWKKGSFVNMTSFGALLFPVYTLLAGIIEWQCTFGGCFSHNTLVSRSYNVRFENKQVWIVFSKSSKGCSNAANINLDKYKKEGVGTLFVFILFLWDIGGGILIHRHHRQPSSSFILQHYTVALGL